ncbi:MAG: GTP-binding protein [Verrucomicrobiota bacterium]
MRITLISGFLGSGKTTLLRRLLRQCRDQRLGVIVNDMSSLDVDGDLVRSGQRLSESTGNFISLAAGSISGSQRQAFAQVLDDWSPRKDLDHILVEASGSSHPWPLIEESNRRPSLTLGCVVTLIDARAFAEDQDGGRLLHQSLIHNKEVGRRTEANLMAEQIQCSSLLLLTKTDRTAPKNLPRMMEYLNRLNPQAAIHPVTHGNISPALLLEDPCCKVAQLRQLAQAGMGSTDQKALGESSSYGIGSAVLTDPRPFHPQRLWDLFHRQLGQGVHRSKGFIWLASRDEQVLLWNQAAGSMGLELLAYWKAALVKDPLGKLLAEEIAHLQLQLKKTDPRFGDRLNEITVIGTDRDRNALMGGLQQCLCTETEVRHWQCGGTFEDPWPQTLRPIP